MPHQVLLLRDKQSVAHGVLNVFPVGGLVKVLWIHAIRVVTPMANLKDLPVGEWPKSVLKNPPSRWDTSLFSDYAK
jgi:hypothetical protein